LTSNYVHGLPSCQGLPRPFRSRVRSESRDRQTDRDACHQFIMPLPTEVGHNKVFSTLHSATFLITRSCR